MLCTSESSRLLFDKAIMMIESHVIRTSGVRGKISP